MVVVASWVVVAGFSVVVVVGFTVVVVVFSVVVVVAGILVRKILFVPNSWVFILWKGFVKIFWI